ncbi:hypothetical protein M8J76_013232 [Diaphorina citri]|nr:hypothetical protein M8J75_014730 [Diaphorina citri]KAI5745662.1 hypothetical protein M8J76_013232 [Diaphorina citri]
MKDTPEEVIEDFGQYADDWWSEKSWNYPLLDLNNLRIPFLQNSLLDAKIISEFAPHKKFPLEGAETTGIDPSEDCIRIAIDHAESLPANVIKPRYFAETSEVHCRKYPEYYDCVICSEVIEHVDGKEKFVDELLQTLKPGGSLIITTPHKTFLAYFSYVIMGEYVIRTAPIGTHHWSKFIAFSTMKSMLKKRGCQIGRTGHFYYNPLTRRWYRTVIYPRFNYLLHATKPKI